MYLNCNCLPGDFTVNCSKRISQLRKIRNRLQIGEALSEIGMTVGGLAALLSLGAFIGAVAPRIDKAQFSLILFGGSVALFGGNMALNYGYRKELDKNWEAIEGIKKEVPQSNKTSNCANCRYFNRESELLLGCAVNPSMPVDCPYFEHKNVAEFSVPGVDVTLIDCSDSEVKEITEIVNRVFYS